MAWGTGREPGYKGAVTYWAKLALLQRGPRFRGKCCRKGSPVLPLLLRAGLGLSGWMKPITSAHRGLEWRRGAGGRVPSQAHVTSLVGWKREQDRVRGGGLRPVLSTESRHPSLSWRTEGRLGTREEQLAQGSPGEASGPRAHFPGSAGAGCWRLRGHPGRTGWGQPDPM